MAGPGVVDEPEAVREYVPAEDLVDLVRMDRGIFFDALLQHDSSCCTANPENGRRLFSNCLPVLIGIDGAACAGRRLRVIPGQAPRPRRMFNCACGAG